MTDEEKAEAVCQALTGARYFVRGPHTPNGTWVAARIRVQDGIATSFAEDGHHWQTHHVDDALVQRLLTTGFWIEVPPEAGEK